MASPSGFWLRTGADLPCEGAMRASISPHVAGASAIGVKKLYLLPVNFGEGVSLCRRGGPIPIAFQVAEALADGRASFEGM